MGLASRLKLVSLPWPTFHSQFTNTSTNNPKFKFKFKIKMASMASSSSSSSPNGKVIDSHLHVWASAEEAAAKYPYFPGQEPTLTAHVHFLLQSMEEAGVDGALIVQPINHKFDHSYVTSVLNKYPNKFVGCCLANPADDASGVQQLEHLVTKDGYSAVRFNPYLWPSGQKMTNEVGKALFSTAGKLGVPVGFMCMKDLAHLLSQVVSSFGANRIMWGSDFPFVELECGYKGALEAVSLIANEISLSPTELEWIRGKTVTHIMMAW